MLYCIQIRSDNDQQVKFRMGTAKDRLNVQSNKGAEKVIGQHSYKPEGFNSYGGMFVNVVGVPKGNKLIECLVFNIPSAVGQFDKGQCLNKTFRYRSDPHPV